MDHSVLWERLLTYFCYFDRTIRRAFIFEPHLQLKIALESLDQSDYVLAQQYNCNREVFELSRKRLIACLLTFSHDELASRLDLHPETKFYLQRLQSVNETRFIENAQTLAQLPQVGPAIRTFFESYADNYSVYKAFTRQGVCLDDNKVFNYDRGVRYFLNPQAKKEQGLQRVLKRYVFSRLVNGTDSILSLVEHIQNASQLHITRWAPQYNYQYAIRRILAECNPVDEVLTIANHVGKDGLAISQLSDDHVMVCAFIFNLYLIDPSIPVGEKLYNQAMTIRPKETLDKLRALSWCKEITPEI